MLQKIKGAVIMEFIDMYINILASIIAMLLMLGIVVLLSIVIAIIIVTGYKKIKEIVKKGLTMFIPYIII